MLKYLLPAIGIIAITSCKKKIEIREVYVDKKKSWTEITRFTGNERIFLSSGSSTDALYFQHPLFFTELKNTDPQNGIVVWFANLPADITVRIPISADFFAYPFSDSVLVVKSNKNPATSPSGGFFNLKQVDPSLKRIQRYFLDLFKCMAITRTGHLLLSYENDRPGNPFTFFVLSIRTTNTYPYTDTLYTKQVTIPKTGFGLVRHLEAVNDYFLVDITDEGIFKIRGDGSFTKVNAPAVVDAIYEWQGKVYAFAEWNRLLISTNNGDSFQEYAGVSDLMTLSRFYTIKDSLVGTYRDNLYTLKWSGNNYTTRLIKNDGLEGSRINGLEILKDTVYAATTAGLYIRPVSSFFDDK